MKTKYFWVVILLWAIALIAGCSDKPNKEAKKQDKLMPTEKGQGQASDGNKHSQSDSLGKENVTNVSEKHIQTNSNTDKEKHNTHAEDNEQSNTSTDKYSQINEKYPDGDITQANALIGFRHTKANVQGYLEYEHIQTGIVFVLIPSCNFFMGSSSAEKYAEPEERPRHRVNLKAFLIARYELTQEQWQRVMGSAPWQGDKYVLEDPKSPASDLTWEDCHSFCEKSGLQLPSEAQWERACRGSSESRNYWGDSLKFADIDQYAWYSGNADQAKQQYPHQVGQKAPNSFGLYDTIGNVYEACSDWYDEDYYQKSPRENPVGPTGGEYRVYRGGGWSSDERFCRASYRFWAAPDYRSGMGMRASKTLGR